MGFLTQFPNPALTKAVNSSDLVFWKDSADLLASEYSVTSMSKAWKCSTKVWFLLVDTMGLSFLEVASFKNLRKFEIFASRDAVPFS